MTTLPAVVRVVDLPAGTTVSGSEIIMAVQTSGGVGQSVQLPLSQAVGTVVGALPPSGGTGQVLKSLGTGFAASWVNLSSLVTASTGLAAVGSTTVAFALASTAGLSVLGVAAVGSAVPAAIAGTAAQVLRVNDGGTAVAFGALNLGSAAAVAGVLPGANFSAVNLAAGGAGGVQGVLPVSNGGQGTSTLTLNGVLFGNGTSTVGLTAQGAANTVLAANSGTPAFSSTPTIAGLGAIGVVTIGSQTAIIAGGTTSFGVKLSSAANFGMFVGSGAPSISAATSSIYLRSDGATATTRIYVNINGTAGWTALVASG